MSANAISPLAARWIRAWLILLGLLVYATILVGGATRLTDSGLSITEWQPVKGALPPIDAASWMAEFDKYRETTQYKLQNKGMSLAEFQFIYWWEWGHRQLGRFIGLVAVVGLPCSRRAAGSSEAWAGNCSASSRSAACKARSAGGWWRAAWATRTGYRSRPTG